MEKTLGDAAAQCEHEEKTMLQAHGRGLMQKRMVGPQKRINRKPEGGGARSRPSREHPHCHLKDCCEDMHPTENHYASSRRSLWARTCRRLITAGDEAVRSTLRTQL